LTAVVDTTINQLQTAGVPYSNEPVNVDKRQEVELMQAKSRLMINDKE
jgi:hypothetical protein